VLVVAALVAATAVSLRERIALLAVLVAVVVAQAMEPCHM